MHQTLINASNAFNLLHPRRKKIFFLPPSAIGMVEIAGSMHKHFTQVLFFFGAQATAAPCNILFAPPIGFST